MATVNQVFGAAAQQQVIDIIKTYDPIIAKAPNADVSNSIAFLSNPLHTAAVSMALDTFGPPAPFTERMTGIYAINAMMKFKTKPCENYKPINDLYFAASIYFKYPKPANDDANCQILKGYINALDNETIAADKLFVANGNGCMHNSALKIIADIQGIYRGMYSGLSCDLVIQRQQAADQLAIAQSQGDYAAQQQLVAQQYQSELAADAAILAAQLQEDVNDNVAGNIANIAGTGLKGTNSFMVYAIIGAAVLLLAGAIIIFKKKTKNQ